MKKIPTLLVRNPDDRAHVLDEVTPGCEWVLVGEGVATRKLDGHGMMVDAEGVWWSRREVKPGKQQPPNYITEDYDSVTGKFQGWEPVEQSGYVKPWREAVITSSVGGFTPGTYELIGPKINSDPENVGEHLLIRHGIEHFLMEYPTDVETIKAVVRMLSVYYGREGLVWHHPDGRMAKLKARDLT
jgi:hypothetical protein